VSETENLPPSCAALAASLIVEGCLPIIQGNVKGTTPIAPATLVEAERAKLGLAPGGMTLFYAAGEEGVFFDMSGNIFTVWFTGDDVIESTRLLHEALTRAFPKAKQLDEVKHKADSRMRARVYRVELGAGRLAAIETSFALAGGRHKFMARVIAQQRPS
jgi:hypothetical protein